jgi:hypothetical protein
MSVGKTVRYPPPLMLGACVVPPNPALTGVDRVMHDNICPLMLMRFTPMRGWCRYGLVYLSIPSGFLVVFE